MTLNQFQDNIALEDMKLRRTEEGVEPRKEIKKNKKKRKESRPIQR
jgi:hypothetical protein